MSSTDLDDESILIQENPIEDVPQNIEIDLNDVDQIAELLAEPTNEPSASGEEIEEEIVEKPEKTPENSVENEEKSVNNNKKPAEEVEEVDEDLILLGDDEEIIEEIVIPPENSAILEDDDVILEKEPVGEENAVNLEDDDIILDKEHTREENPMDLEDDDIILEKEHTGEENAAILEDDDIILEKEPTGEENPVNMEDDDDIILEKEHTLEEPSCSTSSTAPTKSRKRSSCQFSPKSPVHKRNRRVRTYFGTRQAAINIITGILGSYDGFLHKKDTEFLMRCASFKAKQAESQKENIIQQLSKENAQLAADLKEEKRNHNLTIKCFEQIQQQFKELEAQVEKFHAMATQMPTPEVVEMQFPPNHLNPPHPPPTQYVVQPPQHQIPHRMMRPNILHQQNQFQHQQQHQIHKVRNPVIRRMPTAVVGQNGSVAMVVPQNHQIHRQQQQMPPVVARQPRVIAPAPVDFESIPIPNINLGHRDEPFNQTLPQRIRDLTDSALIANQLQLHVPHVDVSNIVPRDEPNTPILPYQFLRYKANPNLSVSINSSSADFRDNWILGGKITYGQLDGLPRKKIQLFIQLSSFKTRGIIGHVSATPNGQMGSSIDWGTSSKHACRAKSHKFRIVFHQSQKIPLDELVTVFVVAWDNGGVAEISQPFSMRL